MNRLDSFDRALEAADVNQALLTAAKMPTLDLARALQLTLLLAECRSPQFEAAARRLIIRFTEELRPSPIQIRKLADCLDCLTDARWEREAREGLRRLLEQIRVRAAGQSGRVEVEFNGMVERLY